VASAGMEVGTGFVVKRYSLTNNLKLADITLLLATSVA
jgi:hypothetical protein